MSTNSINVPTPPGVPLVRRVPLGSVRFASTLSPAFINLATSRYPAVERFLAKSSSECWDAFESISRGLGLKTKFQSSEKIRDFFNEVERDCGHIPSSTEISSDILLGTRPNASRQLYVNKLVEYIKANRNNAPALAAITQHPLPLEALQVVVAAARDFLSEQGCDMVLGNVAKQLSPTLMLHTLGNGHRDLFNYLRGEGEYLPMHDVLAKKVGEMAGMGLSGKSLQFQQWLDEGIGFYARSPRRQAVIEVLKYSREPQVLRSVVAEFQQQPAEPGFASRIAEALLQNPRTPVDVIETLGQSPRFCDGRIDGISVKKLARDLVVARRDAAEHHVAGMNA